MSKLSVAVKALLIINVGLFFLTVNWDSRLMLALFPFGSELFRPFQLLSHFFMHASVGHLLFNMFGLYMFGPVLERIWGAQKFLIYYTLCAAGAAMLHVVVTNFGSAEDLRPMLGASGAIYGVFAGFAMLFPNEKIMLLIPPIPLKAKYMILGLIALDLGGGLSGIDSGIAHFAHIGGAVVGIVMVLAWKRTLPAA